MLEINLDGLYTGVNTKSILTQQATLYQTRRDEMWDFLKATNHKTPYYKVLHNNYYEDEFPQYEEIAKECRNEFKHFIFIGMGGAIHNSKMISSLIKDQEVLKNIHFLYTLDPIELTRILHNVNIKDTAILLFSNTGKTIEVLSLYLALKKIFDKHHLPIKRHFFFITNRNEGPLNKIANEEGAAIIPYGEDFGGRFSTFSNSVVFAGLVMGVDMREFIYAHNYYLNIFWKQGIKSDPAQAAEHTFFLRRKIMPLITYTSKLYSYLEWSAQIISESLGKDNRGYAPVISMGPQQQHTLFEYFVSGTNDHIATFYNYRKPEQDFQLAKYSNQSLSEQNLKTINDRMCRSTIEFFQSKQIPTRTVTLSEFNESSYAQLITFTMIEIILLSLYHRTHPFLQPAVEEGKKYMINTYFKAS